MAAARWPHAIARQPSAKVRSALAPGLTSCDPVEGETLPAPALAGRCSHDARGYKNQPQCCCIRPRAGLTGASRRALQRAHRHVSGSLESRMRVPWKWRRRFDVRCFAVFAAFLSTERVTTENQSVSGAVSKPFTELSTVLGGNPRQFHRPVMWICRELLPARKRYPGEIGLVQALRRYPPCQGTRQRTRFPVARQGLASPARFPVRIEK